MHFQEVRREEPPTVPWQSVSTVTLLDGFNLSLHSFFLRLPKAAIENNEPVLLDALRDMAEINIRTQEVTSFEKLADELALERFSDKPRQDFLAALRKALAEDCAVVAIRNPPFDFGKELLDKAFPGGTIIAAMTHAPDPQTFIAYVVMAGAGLVGIRVCKSVADGGDKVIQAIAANIARKFEPPQELDMPKKKGKDKSAD